MKTVCIVDTCSLLYLSDIELGTKTVHQWLFDEFNVLYSKAVYEEIQRNSEKMGKDAHRFRSRTKGAKNVRTLSQITTIENALFAPPFYRKVEASTCSRCKNPTIEDDLYEPDLSEKEDRGERHNCCVSLDVVLKTKHQQVIFLTDDHKAIRNYVAPVFEVFPLGTIWSSQDLILHLFTRHRKYIILESAQNAIQDTVAKAIQPLLKQPETQTYRAKQKWMKRRTDYERKIQRVDIVLRQLGGRVR